MGFYPDKKKIKAVYAGIVVGNMGESPLYKIIYLDEREGEWHVGYSSYYVGTIRSWLESEFEPGYKDLADAITDLLARLEDAEARSEKAEKERDECIARYHTKEPCTTCIHWGAKECDENCLVCTDDCPCNKCEKYDKWEWNSRKKEE